MDLSVNWQIKPLGEVATLQRGFDLPVDKRIEGDFPVFAANGPVGTHNIAKVKGPGVVTGRSGTLGKVHYVAGDYWPLNTALWVKNFHGNDPKWVARLLSWLRLETHTRGTGVPTLNRNLVHVVPVAVPPLEEQRRIAAILDKADEVRRKRQEAIRLTEELLRSLFLDMFGDPVTNPKGWEVVKLKNFGEIITGNTPSRSDPENYGDEIEWIKSDNITTPEHFLTPAIECLSKKGKKSARFVPTGSVLVACIAGSRSSIGRAAIADREVAFNQQINAIIPNSDVDTYFLYTHFLIAQHLIQAKSTNSMKGLVSKSRFASVEFMKPPVEQQQKFGVWFVHFYNWYKTMLENDLLSDDFFNSLLQRAFRGEL